MEGKNEEEKPDENTLSEAVCVAEVGSLHDCGSCCRVITSGPDPAHLQLLLTLEIKPLYLV